ncbi:hypothetical protein ACKVMT_10065 [Halobacteriales archaeon Cl-PHB]
MPVESLPTDLIAFALLAFLAGMAVPTEYGMERVAGFGRWFASKFPYKPPEDGETIEDKAEKAPEEG